MLPKWHLLMAILSGIAGFVILLISNDNLYFALSPIIGVGILVHVLVASSYKKANSILLNKCDPVTFIEVFERLQNSTKNNAELQKITSLQLSTGYYYLDDLDKMGNALRIEQGNESRLYPKKFRYNYYNNLFIYHLGKGNLTSAEEMLNQCRQTAIELKIIDKHSQQIESFEYALRLAQGNYENAEQAYKKLFNNAPNNLNRVMIQLRLGKIYLHDDRREEAKVAFEYVIEHGNTLACVEHARIALNDCIGGAC